MVTADSTTCAFAPTQLLVTVTCGGQLGIKGNWQAGNDNSARKDNEERANSSEDWPVDKEVNEQGEHSSRGSTCLEQTRNRVGPDLAHGLHRRSVNKELRAGDDDLIPFV